MKNVDNLLLLNEQVTTLTAGAERAGHVLNPWQYDGPTAVVYCKACGKSTAVRVGSIPALRDGLSLPQCPGKNGDK